MARNPQREDLQMLYIRAQVLQCLNEITGSQYSRIQDAERALREYLASVEAALVEINEEREWLRSE